MIPDFLSEFMNSFEELHYFIVGLAAGLIFGILLAVKYLARVHKFYFKDRENE